MTAYNPEKNNSNKEEDSPTIKFLKLLGIVVGILGAITTILATAIAIYKNIEDNKPLSITVENRLALPIIVTINNSYNTRIQAGGTQAITLLSNDEFPASVKWKVQRNKSNSGQPLGEEIGEEIKRVDKGVKMTVDNEIGLIAYFYPVVLNNTDSKCTIIVNDGLNIKYDIGISNPHRLTNITGYYKYATNSNVTLKCADQTYWLGKRNGKQSDGKITLSSGSGTVEVVIP